MDRILTAGPTQGGAPRARMADIARQAGVSLATVDRVINGRGLVKARTRDEVLAAAKCLAYPVAVQEPSSLAFDVILPAGPNTFLDRLADEVERAASELAPSPTVRFDRVAAMDAEALAAALDGVERSDGVGLVALDHPAVRDALRRLEARGMRVATMVSNMSDARSLGHIGIDDRAAGRLAGLLVGRLVGDRPGTVLLVPGHRRYRCHEEREIGCRHVIEDEFPDLSITSLPGRWDGAGLREELGRHLGAGADVVAVYNVGAGNRDVAAALEADARGRRVVFVAHELTEHTREMLASGLLDVAIDQDPRRTARTLLRLLSDHARGTAADPVRPIRIVPFFRENLP